ncbi:unnamed protein product [Lupinus luteus]|uniref:Uncharacterized protein n=1 Tax=Lupinus luteus TaxID=3873 RepID=A0AAV1WKP7_LUPLU
MDALQLTQEWDGSGPPINEEGISKFILPKNRKRSAMPGRGDGKVKGSEERKGGSQCFSTPKEMRQPRDALLLTPQGSETELNLSLGSEDFVASLQYEYSNDHSDLLLYLLVRQDPIGHEHRKVLLFVNPSIPLVGMGRPTTSLSLRPRPSQWGDPVGLPPPPKKTKTVCDSFPSYGSNHSQMPREASFPSLLGWFTRAQTSTGHNSREL